MAYRCAVVLLLAMALASCSPGRRSSTTSTESDAETAKRPALTQSPQPMDAAGRAYMLEPGAGVGAAVPPMEPGRPINNQDCTKEIALTGNLNCR